MWTEKSCVLAMVSTGVNRTSAIRIMAEKKDTM
jgi:hypothetical protein